MQGLAPSSPSPSHPTLPFPCPAPGTPEVAGSCHLPQQDGEAGEDGAGAGSGGVELQLAAQVSPEQVEPGRGQVATPFHRPPNLLGNLQQQLQLRRRPVETLVSRRANLEGTHGGERGDGGETGG